MDAAAPDDPAGAIARIIRDIADRPIDPARLAAKEAARTDPWRWYCRHCGEKGEAADPATRDQAGKAHLEQAPCGRHEITGWVTAGRLLHVWTYPKSAIAWQN